MGDPAPPASSGGSLPNPSHFLVPEAQTCASDDCTSTKLHPCSFRASNGSAVFVDGSRSFDSDTLHLSRESCSRCFLVPRALVAEGRSQPGELIRLRTTWAHHGPPPRQCLLQGIAEAKIPPTLRSPQYMEIHKIIEWMELKLEIGKEAGGPCTTEDCGPKL